MMSTPRYSAMAEILRQVATVGLPRRHKVFTAYQVVSDIVSEVPINRK